MPGFDVTSEQGADDDHAWLITITGDVDATTGQSLDNAFDDVIAHGARFITLELTDVSSLSSTGLRSIVRVSNLLSEHDGRLVLAGLSGAAKRVLERTGLISHLANQ